MEQLRKTIKGIADRGAEQIFVNGGWRKSTGAQQLSVVAPHTEEVLMQYTESSKADIDAAVAAAREAFDKGPWPRMTPQERGVYLRKIGDQLTARMPELAEAWTGQVGAVIGFTSKASYQCPGLFKFYAGLCDTYNFVDERKRSAGGFARVVGEPVGVVAP